MCDYGNMLCGSAAWGHRPPRVHFPLYFQLSLSCCDSKHFSPHSLAEKTLRLFFNSLYSFSLNFLFYGSHPVCLWSWCFVSTERKVRICGGREATRVPSEQERTRGVSGRSSGLSASVWVGPLDMLRHESHIHSIMLQTQEKHGKIIMKDIAMS